MYTSVNLMGIYLVASIGKRLNFKRLYPEILVVDEGVYHIDSACFVVSTL